MKVKELKEILNSYPDDMEVMNYDEVTGPYPLEIPNQRELWFIQHHEWNSKPFEWQSWDYPIQYPLYKAELIKKEECLIFSY